MPPIIPSTTFIRLVILSLVMVWSLVGCQTNRQPRSGAVLDNEAFMKLWERYQHCRSSTDVVVIRDDLRQLKQGAALPMAGMDFQVPLPPAIARLVTQPPSRLAVDPMAMVLACALHAGDVVLDAGYKFLATSLFESVLRQAPNSEYGFYVGQARLGLDVATRTQDDSRRGAPARRWPSRVEYDEQVEWPAFPDALRANQCDVPMKGTVSKLVLTQGEHRRALDEALQRDGMMLVTEARPSGPADFSKRRDFAREPQ